MIAIPALLPHLELASLGDEGVVVRSATGNTLLEGRLYARVMALVDGLRSADAIADALPEFGSHEVYYALLQLEKRGYLVESYSAPRAEAAYWSLQDLPPSLADRRPLVALRGLETLSGVELVPEEKAELLVVVTHDLLHPQPLPDKPVLLAGAEGSEVRIGPLLEPGKPGCWDCLARRLAANRPVDRFLAQKSLLPLTAALNVLEPMLALEAARFCGAGSSPWQGAMLTLDVLTWKSERHLFGGLPHCPTCGGPPPQPRVPLLVSRPAVQGLRSQPPEKVYQRYEPHLSRLTGAVSKLVRATPPDEPLHVYLAAHHRANVSNSFDRLRRGLRNMSAGKGAHETQARTGALCEALERYSALFQGYEARERRLMGPDDLHPNACMGYSEEQYARREEWNARGYLYNWIPERFKTELPIHWSPVWSLTRERWRYLPTQYCYFGFVDPDQPLAAMSCTNGNAAGACHEEAALHALLELIERDAIALWWYNRVRRPAVRLEDPYSLEVAARLERSGRDLWVLDLTTEFGVPVYAALSRSREGPERILLGAGAHLDPVLAVQRAVSELVQMVTRVLFHDDPDGLDGSELEQWMQRARLQDEPYLAGQGEVCATTRVGPTDLLEAVTSVRRALEAQGHEVLLLDLTRPELDLPVVKAFVPGLRHFWTRFAPGRLYEAPVRLGWRETALDEAGLNPWPMFL